MSFFPPCDEVCACMCVLRSVSFPRMRQEDLISLRRARVEWRKEVKWSDLICRLPSPASSLCGYLVCTLQAVLKLEADDRMSQREGECRWSFH